MSVGITMNDFQPKFYYGGEVSTVQYWEFLMFQMFVDHYRKGFKNKEDLRRNLSGIFTNLGKPPIVKALKTIETFKYLLDEDLLNAARDLFDQLWKENELSESKPNNG